MCERCERVRGEWLGWSELPPAEILSPVGDWIDLTHPICATMPCASIFPAPSLERLRSLPGDPFNVTALHMVTHAGTHVDAPLHFFPDGPDAAAIPFDRLHGPGVVWHVEVEPDEVIGVAALERCRPMLRAGDILALDTGWAARFGTAAYERHPSLDAEGAAWLVARGIKLLACDFATPDLVYHLRPPEFDWPVHCTLLARGILICEHLTGHAALAGERVEFRFAALPVVGGDGAPARVYARSLAS